MPQFGSDTMQTNPITEDLVTKALREVIDPEIGCNIVDLGLIYSVNISAANVTVTMTLTTPGCPMHESIRWGVETSLLGLEGVGDVQVDLVWDPPWNPSMMTEFGRAATGAGSY
jgi:metal-sulfur cluster biosynthetic enzyme